MSKVRLYAAAGATGFVAGWGGVFVGMALAGAGKPNVGAMLFAGIVGAMMCIATAWGQSR